MVVLQVQIKYGLSENRRKGRKRYKYIYTHISSSKLTIISMNDKYMSNEIGKNYDKVKYQLFSVTSVEDVH